MEQAGDQLEVFEECLLAPTMRAGEVLEGHLVCIDETTDLWGVVEGRPLRSCSAAVDPDVLPLLGP